MRINRFGAEATLDFGPSLVHEFLHMEYSQVILILEALIYAELE